MRRRRHCRGRGRDGGLDRLRPDARQQPAFAADPDRPEQRRPHGPRLHRRPPPRRSGRAPWTAVVSARDRRHALRDDEQQLRLRARRRHRQGQVGVQAPEQRPLRQLRRRRQPRARVLRRQALHDDARHAARRAAPERRRGGGEDRDQPVRPQRRRQLRLLADERPDLRGWEGRDGSGRLRVRRPRLRDGVQHGPHARMAESVLDDPAGAAAVASALTDRRRRCRLDAGHDRRPHQHRLFRHRLRDAELLPRPPSGAESARELPDRRRPQHGQAALVAAARRERPVELRRRAAAARVRRQGRRQDAARRLGGVEGRRLVRPRRAHRSDAAPAGEGDRPGRASAASARAAGDDLPLRARRRELLAGLLRSRDQLRLQRRGGDGGRADPGQADADAEAAEADPGRRLPRAAERELRHRPRELARPRLDQRHQRRHRQAGVEVPDTRARAWWHHDDRQRARLRRRRRRRPPCLRHAEREGALALPDRRADRSRADALPERRQGVPRDHGRRHADLVERRCRGRVAGLRDRRQPAAVVTALRVDADRIRRGRSTPGRLDADDEPEARLRRPSRRPVAHDSRPVGRSRFAPGFPPATTPRSRGAGCSSAASPSPARGSRSTATC